MAEATRTLRINVTVDHRSGQRNLRSLNQSLGQTKTASLGAAAAIGGMVARLGGIALLAEGFRRAAGSSIAMNRQLETATLQFQGMMGSAERAEAHVRSLFTFAQRTPFETQPIIEASRLMQVFGGDALNTAENLRMIGDAAAQTSVPINELGMWTGRLFAALQGGQPIGEATMRLMEMGAISPQVVAQLREMNQAGEDATVTWGVFTEAMAAHEGAMERQAESFEGLISSLADNTAILLGRVGEPIFELAKVGLAEANDRVGDLSEALEGSISVWQSVGRAIQGDTDALHLLRDGLFLTTEEFVSNQQAMEAFEEKTLALREAVAGPVGLSLGVTSAQEALALFEPQSQRITEETERMRVATDAATAAFHAMRQAEDELLVTAPKVIMTWEEMINVGTRLADETLPVLESRTIDLSDAMMGGPQSATESAKGFGAAIFAELGVGGRASEAVTSFHQLMTGTGGFLPTLNTDLAQNALSWMGWGQNVINQLQSVWGWVQKLGGSGGSAGGALSTVGGVVSSIAGPVGAGVALAQLWQALGAPGAPTGLNHPTASISSPETNAGNPSDSDFSGMATGGAGIVTRPTLFLAGENGPEAFSFRPTGAQMAAGGVGGVTFNFAFSGFSGSLRDAERVTEMVERRIMQRLGTRRVGGGVV